MITDIRLQNFRSYVDAAFEFDPAVNIVVGPNASGKTNLLEAILVVAIGKSYRAGSHELIKLGKDWLRLEAHTVEGNRVVKIKNGDSASKEFQIDQANYKRLPVAKMLPVVLFEPQHLLLLTGRPEMRRDYLDDLLEQTNPTFGKSRRDYRRALAQRNTLLKTNPQQTKNQLFAWNVRLSELGGTIVAARQQLVDELNQQLGQVYKQLARSRLTVTVNYLSQLPTKNYVSNLLHNLEKHMALDYQRGFTGYGPHREDFMITMNGSLAQNVASRGETRTLVLGLKFLEISILEKTKPQKPIILLDDVFSELDGARRQALTKYLKNYQTFITTTDADLIMHNFAQKTNVITLS